MIYLIAAIAILAIITYFFTSKRKKGEPIKHVDTDCCGAHEVCEKNHVHLGDKPVYYEDEELDRFIGYNPDNYTEKDIEMFNDIFYTLLDSDVNGWIRSLEHRNIPLPQSIRDEVVFVLSERRTAK